MQRLVIGCALLAVAALTAGCMSYGPAAGSAGGSVPLEGTQWRLTELGGRPARPAGEDAPNLRLTAADKRAGGNTGCNSFGGEYTLSGESLRFGMLASTRRACTDEALNAQEGTYLRALENVHTWRITGDTLELHGESGVVARFVAQSAG